MRSAEEVFNAAREIAKAQLPDGSYVPTSQLNESQRRGQRAAMGNAGKTGNGSRYGRSSRMFGAPVTGPSTLGVEAARPNSPISTVGTGYSQFREPRPGGRGFNEVYEHWGVGPGLEDAMKEEVRHSSVHRNVRYGSSVSPELARAIDAVLDPKVARGAKHDLVFHLGKTTDGALAAAASAHRTTGNTGRIILNADSVSQSGKIIRGTGGQHFTFRQLINHETVHAQVRGKNPATRFLKPDGSFNTARSLGEEARADAKSTPGPGLYRRTGNVKGRPTARLMAATFDKYPEIRDGARAHLHYSDVHRKIRRRLGQPTGVGGYLKDLPKRGSLMARKPSMVTAALVGGTVAYDSWDTKRQIAAARAARDADGDGRINDGTPQERSVAKRIERDELGRFTVQAGAGVAGAGLAATVGSTVAAERMLRSRGPVEVYRPGGPIPASWDKRRRQTRLVRRAGTHGRNGMAAGLLAVGLGAGIPALEEHAARRKPKTALLDPPRLGAVAKALPRVPKPRRPLWANPNRRAGQDHPHDPDWISRGTHWSPKDGNFAGKTNPNFDPRPRLL